MAALVQFFFLLFVGAVFCSDYMGCSRYLVSNLTGNGGQLSLNGFYDEDRSTTDSYKFDRQDRVSFTWKQRELGYGIETIYYIEFTNLNTSESIDIIYMNKYKIDNRYLVTYNTLSKCFYNGDFSTGICCTSNTADSSSYSSYSGLTTLLTLTIFLEVVLPLFHSCCAKTCFKICTGKNPSRLRIFSMYLSIFQWPWFFFLCICGGLNSKGNCDTQSLNFGLSVYIVSYLVVLFESYRSHERGYIINLDTVEGTKEYISSLYAISPRLILWVKAWHYTKHVRYTTTTTYYNDGSKSKDTQKHKTKVKHVTYNDEQEFDYDTCEDVSMNFDDIEFQPGVTRIQFKLEVRYGDIYTTQKMQEQRQRMINAVKDDYYDNKEYERLQGMVKRASIVSGEKTVFWMKEPYFWLATALCLTWPYRLLYRNFTHKEKYTFVKLVYITSPVGQAQCRTTSVTQQAYFAGVPAPQVSVLQSYSAQQIPYPYNMYQQPTDSNAYFPNQQAPPPYYNAPMQQVQDPEPSNIRKPSREIPVVENKPSSYNLAQQQSRPPSGENVRQAYQPPNTANDKNATSNDENVPRDKGLQQEHDGKRRLPIPDFRRHSKPSTYVVQPEVHAEQHFDDGSSADGSFDGYHSSMPDSSSRDSRSNLGGQRPGYPRNMSDPSLQEPSKELRSNLGGKRSGYSRSMSDSSFGMPPEEYRTRIGGLWNGNPRNMSNSSFEEPQFRRNPIYEEEP